MVAAPPAHNPVRSYAEWFTWARRQVADPARCHAAAGAAMTTLSAGADARAAAAAAQAAATAPDAAARAPIADAGTQAYAGWHAFATFEMKLDNDAAHAAAQAATNAQMQGASPAQSIERARAAVEAPPMASQPAYAGQLQPAYGAPAQAAPPRPAAPSSGFGLAMLADPAARGIAWGVLCLVVPFVAHFYFPVLPLVGLLYGFRALGRSNPVLGMVGLGINGLALLLNLAIIFRLV